MRSRMAGAVQVFRENMIAADRLATAQEAEHAAREQRATRVEALTRGFEDNVGNRVSILASAATEMEATAQSMTSTAGRRTSGRPPWRRRPNRPCRRQTVASAAEELTGSIAEISRQVGQSARSPAKPSMTRAAPTPSCVPWPRARRRSAMWSR